MIVNPIHVFAVIFQNGLSHSVVDIVEIQTRHGIVLPDVVYSQIVCWTEHKAYFWQRKANLVLNGFYTVLLVVDFRSSERSNVLLQCELLKSIFNHDFLFVALHHIPAVIFLLECTLEEIDIKPF